jgi:hypothetical protein
MHLTTFFPDFLVTALNFSGQTETQTPHLMHLFWSMTCASLNLLEMALAGQLSVHIPQDLQRSGSM